MAPTHWTNSSSDPLGGMIVVGSGFGVLVSRLVSRAGAAKAAVVSKAEIAKLRMEGMLLVVFGFRVSSGQSCSGV